MAQLTHVGFDEEDTLRNGVLEDVRFGIDDQSGPTRLEGSYHAPVEVGGDASRQAAADDDVIRRLVETPHGVEALTFFVLAQFGAGHDNAIHLFAAILNHRDILTRSIFDLDAPALDTLGVEQVVQLPAGGSAGGIDGLAPASKHVNDPSHVDPAATWLIRRAAGP